MAFQLYHKPDIVNVLKEIDNNDEEDDHLHKDNINIVRKLTIALKQSYGEISATKSLPLSKIKSKSNYLSNTTLGQLIFNKSFPIILKRYKLIENIANGTFSQIFKAIDLYHNKTIVIKVMNLGYNSLGKREVALLQYISLKTQQGNPFFMRCIGSFMFEEHYCMLLIAYDYTLLNMIRIPRGNNSNSNYNNTNTPDDMKVNDAVSFIQPKVIRPLAGSISNQYSTQYIQPITPSATRPIEIIDQRGINQLRYITLQLISALHLMKCDGLIHADIKPENCFLRFKQQHNSTSNSSNNNTSNNINTLNNRNTSNSNHASSLGSTNISYLNINTLPHSSEYEVVLGDFGNSIHVSEVPQYYSEFEIQSLPYRAPEVLVGLPFGSSIDMWSLGVLLVELIIGDQLFKVRNRSELLQVISSKISPLSPVRFSGGLYTHLLSENSGCYIATNSFSHTDHLKTIKRLLTKSLISTPNHHIQPTSSHSINYSSIQNNQRDIRNNGIGNDYRSSSHVSLISPELIHFLCGLLTPDPSLRFTTADALSHPFLCPIIPIPMVLLNNSTHNDHMIIRQNNTHTSSNSISNSSYNATIALKDNKTSYNSNALSNTRSRAIMASIAVLRKHQKTYCFSTGNSNLAGGAQVHSTPTKSTLMTELSIDKSNSLSNSTVKHKHEYDQPVPSTTTILSSSPLIKYARY